MKLIDRLFRRKPEPVKKPVVDEHTFYFGAPATADPEIKKFHASVPEADEFIVRHRFPPSLYDRHMGNTIGCFLNMRYTTHAEARAAVLNGLLSYLSGDRQYCPVALPVYTGKAP